jgi:hypothetical protein
MDFRYNSKYFPGHPFLILFSVSWGGVKLSPLSMSATNWPIVPLPDDRRWWMWSSRWNENWQGTPKYSEKTCPSASLSTTNPTWTNLGSNPGRRGGKPATNRLSYGTASLFIWLYSPLLELGRFYSFSWSFYTVGRIPWTGDKPVARPLPAHRTTQIQNKRTHRYQYLKLDSNPRC